MKKVLGMVLVLMMCVGLMTADTIKGNVRNTKDLEFKFTTKTTGMVYAGLFWTKRAIDLDGMFVVVAGDTVLSTGIFLTEQDMYESCSFGMVADQVVYVVIWNYGGGSCNAWLNIQQTDPKMKIRKAGDLEITEHSTDPNSDIGRQIRALAEKLKTRKGFY